MLLIALFALVGCAQTPVEETCECPSSGPTVVDVVPEDVDTETSMAVVELDHLPGGASVLFCRTVEDQEACEPYRGSWLTRGATLELYADGWSGDNFPATGHLLVSYW